MAEPILGIDYGAARVGLAIRAEGRPRRFSTLSNTADLLAVLEGVIQEHGVATVVVGLPRGEDGAETQQSAQVRRFASDLYRQTGVRIELQDEFDTSTIARERLGAQAAIQRELIDQEAAVIILEDYERES